MASRHQGLATQQNKRAVQIRSELEVSAVCVFQENTTVADGFVKGIIQNWPLTMGVGRIRIRGALIERFLQSSLSSVPAANQSKEDPWPTITILMP